MQTINVQGMEHFAMSEEASKNLNQAANNPTVTLPYKPWHALLVAQWHLDPRHLCTRSPEERHG
jgi:hypothetical protein